MTEKILLVHHRTDIGGAERSILNLLAGLDRRAYEVIVACPQSGRLCGELARLNIRVFPFEFCGLHNVVALFCNVGGLLRVIRKERIDLIHGNAPQTNVAAALAGRLAGIPVVWHARVLLDPGMIDWDRRFNRLADMIICNSNAIAERFKGIKSFDRKVKVILNGVNTSDFSPEYMSVAAAREKAGIAGEKLVIGCFDRLDPVKDHETTIKAFKEIRRRFPESIFLVVGEALDDSAARKKNLVALAGALGISDAVRFEGFCDDIRPLMAACDVVVQASRSEGCSRSICEAHAMGKPVVASRIGGNPELVEEGRTGLLFSGGDANELAAKLALLIETPARLANMGNTAREKAVREFDLSKYCEQTASVYANLLANRKP